VKQETAFSLSDKLLFNLLVRSVLTLVTFERAARSHMEQHEEEEYLSYVKNTTMLLFFSK